MTANPRVRRLVLPVAAAVASAICLIVVLCAAFILTRPGAEPTIPLQQNVSRERIKVQRRKPRSTQSSDTRDMPSYIYEPSNELIAEMQTLIDNCATAPSGDDPIDAIDWGVVEGYKIMWPGVVGLRNGAAYCFSNAVLQAFLAVRRLACRYVQGVVDCTGIPRDDLLPVMDTEKNLANLFAYAFIENERRERLERQQRELDELIATKKLILDEEQTLLPNTNNELLFDEEAIYPNVDQDFAELEEEIRVQMLKFRDIPDDSREILLEAVRPHELRDHIFQNVDASLASDQQDAHQFITALLTSVGAHVQSLFAFNFDTRMQCVPHTTKLPDTNSHASNKVSSEFLLNVTLPSGMAVSSQQAKDEESAKKWTELSRRFTPLDFLINKDMKREFRKTKCDHQGCKRIYKECDMSFMKPAPSILMLQLQRIIPMSKSNPDLRRINDAIDIPLRMYAEADGSAGSNALRFTTSPKGRAVEYALVAVVLHGGESTVSGHYTAITKNPVDGTWYAHNDILYARLDNAADDAEMGKLLATSLSAKVNLVVYERTYK